jgi:hypothetical protein
VATRESFQHDGPWIKSSEGFSVRSLGRSGSAETADHQSLAIACTAAASRAG